MTAAEPLTVAGRVADALLTFALALMFCAVAIGVGVCLALAGG